jgi:hypothetical protein
MAYSKAKLKSSGDKASPCFRPFWIMSPKKTLMQEKKEKHVFALCIFCKEFSHTTGIIMEQTYTTPHKHA